MDRDRKIPEVNAGSMADIAFLLLIFFLVATSIETDVGLDRKLPPNDTSPPIPIAERNIFRVALNKNNELFVEDGIMQLKDLQAAAIAFLDNGAGTIGSKEYCDYCQGERNAESSENPDKAIISFNSDREASYGMYVSVQNELTSAYNTLRNREAVRLFNQDYVSMEKAYYAPETAVEAKISLKKNIEQIRQMFPMKLIEAETHKKG
ncbi:biopolymer transporter ExbD [Muricauda sp. CAU 1633]|uniref:ExbD/TolR family protein n=1 Tax=Allomuricauda sp. CAU 1633 TaxID=2816036 RepID=UPI001A908D7D|nr:biopolymer transporter ExbD [Muricauda sp. CAU 1633]MBO0322956.1 biopolymer transporter ExbD [Muricauda sp. CAU 1633]